MTTVEVKPRSSITRTLTIIVAIGLIAVGVFYVHGCKGTTGYHIKSDTTKTVGLYMPDPTTELLQASILFKVTRDTFLIVGIDTIGDNLKARREWRHDTIYWYPKLTPIKDTAGHEKKDTAGHTLNQVMYYPISPRLVVKDFNYPMSLR